MAEVNKLELTWVGKDKPINVEPRILIEKKELGNTTNDANTENMLIHGDNLLALKALENKYAGKVKCIYIDPPYNTGNAFEHYDDNLEHSIWLSLMRERLAILRSLLVENGVLWVQIDDDEQAYLKVLCDEIFGRKNFINMISVNMKNIAGASGGGEDKRLKKNCEYILLYTKDYDTLSSLPPVYNYVEMYNVVEQYRLNKKNWHYTSVLMNTGNKVYIDSTVDGEGNEIKIYRRENTIIKSINQIISDEGISEKDVYYKYGHLIFEAKDAQSSIRTRVIEAKQKLNIQDDIISIEYVPKTGKNKGHLYEQFYKGEKCRLFAWLKDISESIDGVLYKKERQGTFWDYTANINNLTKEGSVVFPNGKKPEALIQRILEISTKEKDLVLDSFLGSGTTAAVAQKMGRQYIGIEMGNHAYTHCKVRLDKVIEGEQGGISKSVNWKGGGAYRFYELAPTLIKEDAFGQAIINPEYNAEMLANAVSVHEGYTYNPQEDCYWKQASNDANSYLFVTTRHINKEYIDSILSEMKEDEFLLIVCKSYDASVVHESKKIAIKKIPQSLLKNCEFGVNDYSLNIICPPTYEEEYDED